LGDRPSGDPARLGILCGVMGGSVIYSRRFFEEVRRDPPTASPLLFPETVFNAPASHLGAILGRTGRNDTLVGDQTGFLHALALGATWLTDGVVDSCLVVGSEEADWLTAEATGLFHRQIPTAEGAGALLLSREFSPVELLGVTEPEAFTAGQSRWVAARRVAEQLGLGRVPTPLWEVGWEHPEDHGAAVTAMVPIVGDGLAAGGAWACVAAVHALQQARVNRAAVRVLGANLQALGALFGRTSA
jgi:3-oxoacyl-(acyl-carrier-protein) synthase